MSVHVTNVKIKSEWTDYNKHLNMAYYVLVFDQAREILLEKFAEKMDSDEYEMDVLKIGEFLATGTCGDYNDYSIFIKYRSEEELFYKIVYHLFDRLIIFLQEEYERTLTIEENMRKICFDRHFCLNKNVKIY